MLIDDDVIHPDQPQIVTEHARSSGTALAEPSVARSNFEILATTESSKVVQAAHNSAVLELAKNDEQVATKINDVAKKNIDTALETEADKVKIEATKAKFRLNESACSVYGVEEEFTPRWQQRLMKVGAGFWFIIYFLTIGSFVVAPIATFTIKLTNIFKKTWIAILASILIYLLFAAVLPLLLRLEIL